MTDSGVQQAITIISARAEMYRQKQAGAEQKPDALDDTMTRAEHYADLVLAMEYLIGALETEAS